MTQASASDLAQVLEDLYTELGCEHDNEAALVAISRLKAKRSVASIEKVVVTYFKAVDADVIESGVECHLSLYDEGPSISLTSLAVALARFELEAQND